jgi:hypothetical protein
MNATQTLYADIISNVSSSVFDLIKIETGCQGEKYVYLLVPAEGRLPDVSLIAHFLIKSTAARTNLVSRDQADALHAILSSARSKWQELTMQSPELKAIIREFQNAR